MEHGVASERLGLFLETREHGFHNFAVLAGRHQRTRRTEIHSPSVLRLRGGEEFELEGATDGTFETYSVLARFSVAYMSGNKFTNFLTILPVVVLQAVANLNGLCVICLPLLYYSLQDQRFAVSLIYATFSNPLSV